MTANPPNPRRASRWRAALTMGVYHLVFLIGFLAYSPVLLWRMAFDHRYRRGILQRMGWVPRRVSERAALWIHGVSVGEIKAAGTLIRALQLAHPELELVLSSTTPTGHELASKLYADHRVIFYPLDFGRFPGRALDRIAPAAVLLVELEIWPNFLQQAARRGIPVSVVNGRISARSFKGYRRARGFLPQFNLIRHFCVQDESYRARLLELDVDAQALYVTGNLKYDSVALKEAPEGSADLRAWLSPDARPVIVCGSTHGDEDLCLARIVQRLAQRRDAPLRLVLAPRHPERAVAVRDALAGAGFRCVSWSTLPSEREPLASEAILIVDTIGQLEAFYGVCDIAFVGGSLVPHGGQNMLEPAALGKAVVFGPHVDNFLKDVGLLLAGDGCVQVSDADALEREIADLLADDARRAALGRNAIEVIRGNQGATARTLEILRPMLEKLARGAETRSLTEWTASAEPGRARSSR